MGLDTVSHDTMLEGDAFDSQWGRDVGLVVLGWLLASVLAIVLLLTLVRGALV